jgi:hypothetical protein
VVRVPCEFFLIQYVPDVVKGEFVNIGVVLREAAGRGEGARPQTQIRFTRNWARVRCLDADADLELLEALEQDLPKRLQMEMSTQDPKDAFGFFQETLSNSLQITEPKATLAENMTAEMDQLMQLYVEPLKVAKVKEERGRAFIGRARLQRAMQTEFRNAGVWNQMWQRIPASRYTRAGDPLRIDCGYRKNELAHLFQAVSLTGDVESAKSLAFSMDALRAGVKREETAELDFAAVVEPLRSVAEPGSEEEECYLFGKETMERQQIRVLTISDLSRTAETARLELGI